MVRLRVALLALCVGALTACGGGDPDGVQAIRDGLDHVFVQDKVVSIDITPAGGLDGLIEAYMASGSPEFVNSGFVFDGAEALDSVGLRLRAPVQDGGGQIEIKYSLKINFNYFDGPRFHAIDKVYLSANKSDPSLMRDRLAERMFEAMGVPASRTSYVWVKSDGDDVGIYTLMEEVDKRFIRARFGDENDADDGNLYKCEPPGCSLVWKGDKKADYLDMTCMEEDGCGLVLKTNEDDATMNDYSDLIDMLDVLNNTDDGDFKEEFDRVFDVDTFVRYLAVAVCIGDYDGYLGAIDNFYLYHQPDTGKFVFIPWDHRKAFGRKNCALAEDPSGGRVDSPECTDDSRPLVERVLAVPEWRDLYYAYVKEVYSGWLKSERVQPWIDEFDGLIGGLVDQDPNTSITSAVYEQAISDKASDDEDMNVMEFVNKRREYVGSQLDELGVK